MDMVNAVNLKKYYVTDTYEVHALDGVSLTAGEGEFLAVVGTVGQRKDHSFEYSGRAGYSRFRWSLDPWNQSERSGQGRTYSISEAEYRFCVPTV